MKRVEIYKLAIENRAREIELFWKRAAFFWAFQVFAATVAGLVLSREGGLGQFSSIAIVIAIGVGFASAWSGYLSARGSKYWQEVWEKKVEIIESEYPLFRSNVWVKFGWSGAGAFSVSKQVIIFKLFLSLIWCALWIGVVFSLIRQVAIDGWSEYYVFQSIIVLVVSVFVALFCCVGRTHSAMAQRDESKQVSERLKDRKEFWID